MEWLADNPELGRRILILITILGVCAILWFGGRRIQLSIPCAVVFLFLALIAIPGFIPARYIAQRNACIHNLRQLHEAKLKWAEVSGKTASHTPTEQDLFGTDGTNGLLRKPLSCPRGGVYTLGRMDELPSCSFAGKRHRLEK